MPTQFWFDLIMMKYNAVVAVAVVDNIRQNIYNIRQMNLLEYIIKYTHNGAIHAYNILIAN